MTLSPVAKAVVAFVFGLINFLCQPGTGLLVDGTFDKNDAFNLVGWIVATAAVYAVPNRPATPRT